MLADRAMKFGPDSLFEEYMKSATEKRLDQMGGLTGQFRTIIKKLEFLLLFEKNHRDIKKTCKAAGINSRRTFYNWIETDPVFKGMLGVDFSIEQREYINGRYWKRKTLDMRDALDLEATMEKNEKRWTRLITRQYP